MAGNGNHSSNGKGSFFAGILFGMLLGLAIAGGVAWYILEKNPETFHAKEPPHEVPKMALPASASIAVSAVPEAKPHFEFYKTLPDTPEITSARKSSEKAAPKESHQATTHPVPNMQPVSPAVPKETYIVQAGSFQNPDDAEKLKAKLAMSGIEASVQTITLTDKGVWHRVRLGPYKGLDEANNAVSMLKLNGVANATPVRIQ
jgi:cell division protein FtsN